MKINFRVQLEAGIAEREGVAVRLMVGCPYARLLRGMYMLRAFNDEAAAVKVWG
jgi:hypothetical protein